MIAFTQASRAQEGKNEMKMKQRIGPVYDFQFEMNTIWLEWNGAVYNKSCVIDDFKVHTKSTSEAKGKRTRTQITTGKYHNEF